MATALMKEPIIIPLNMVGVPDDERGTWMQTFSGRFYPLDPRPEEFYITDIALSLSRINRYNGHNDAPLSVAQHSVQCVDLARRDKAGRHVERYMLMHDAPEAYIGDMVRPLKSVIPQFREIEAKVWAACVKRFDIEPVDPDLFQHYDNLACAWEKRDLCKSYESWPGMPVVPNSLPEMSAWTAKIAERMFMEYFNYLWGRGLENDRQRR